MDQEEFLKSDIALTFGETCTTLGKVLGMIAPSAAVSSATVIVWDAQLFNLQVMVEETRERVEFVGCLLDCNRFSELYLMVGLVFCQSLHKKGRLLLVLPGWAWFSHWLL